MSFPVQTKDVGPPVHLDQHVSQFSSSSIEFRQDISYDKLTGYLPYLPNMR
jgi:hypothetical protein